MPLIAASAAYQKTEERRRDKEQRKGRKGDEGKRNGFLAALRSRWKIQEKKKDSGLTAAEIIMKEMIIINTDQTEKEKNTMKKRVITTFMKKHLMKTTALCAAAVIAAAGSGMTANASGPFYTEGDGWFSEGKQDNAEYEEAYGNENGWETMTYTWDVGDSTPANTSADAGTSSASNESYDNVSYDSSSEVSYDSGSSNESYDEAGSDYTDNSTMNSNTAASAQTAAGTSGVERKGNTVTVPGKETFRQKSSSANGTYTVIHMGQEKYTLQLKDAAGNNVGFKGVGMYKADDGRYFINVVPNDGADTAGWSVITMKGDKAYLPKLGISGVALNGTVIVDVDAEAAAQ